MLDLLPLLEHLRLYVGHAFEELPGRTGDVLDDDLVKFGLKEGLQLTSRAKRLYVRKPTLPEWRVALPGSSPLSATDLLSERRIDLIGFYLRGAHSYGNRTPYYLARPAFRRHLYLLLQSRVVLLRGNPALKPVLLFELVNLACGLFVGLRFSSNLEPKERIDWLKLGTALLDSVDELSLHRKDVEADPAGIANGETLQLYYGAQFDHALAVRAMEAANIHLPPECLLKSRPQMFELAPQASALTHLWQLTSQARVAASLGDILAVKMIQREAARLVDSLKWYEVRVDPRNQSFLRATDPGRTVENDSRTVAGVKYMIDALARVTELTIDQGALSRRELREDSERFAQARACFQHGVVWNHAYAHLLIVEAAFQLTTAKRYSSSRKRFSEAVARLELAEELFAGTNDLIMQRRAARLAADLTTHSGSPIDNSHVAALFFGR